MLATTSGVTGPSGELQVARYASKLRDSGRRQGKK